MNKDHNIPSIVSLVLGVIFFILAFCCLSCDIIANIFFITSFVALFMSAIFLFIEWIKTKKVVWRCETLITIVGSVLWSILPIALICTHDPDWKWDTANLLPAIFTWISAAIMLTGIPLSYVRDKSR